jgi:hypothetical protein
MDRYRKTSLLSMRYTCSKAYVEVHVSKHHETTVSDIIYGNFVELDVMFPH